MVLPNVVFPQPLSPTNPNTSPFFIESVTSSTAFKTDFFEENKEWLVSIGKKMGVPAFFKLMPEMSHYYVIKNEYQFIAEDKSNIQVSTVQWDVKDGKRFNIAYIDEQDQKRPCPVIIHASSFGSIERTLCAILENIALDEARGVPPMFPLWLAPTQVRIIPVSDTYPAFAIDICDRISCPGVFAISVMLPTRWLFLLCRMSVSPISSHL